MNMRDSFQKKISDVKNNLDKAVNPDPKLGASWDGLVSEAKGVSKTLYSDGSERRLRRRASSSALSTLHRALSHRITGDRPYTGTEQLYAQGADHFGSLFITSYSHGSVWFAGASAGAAGLCCIAEYKIRNENNKIAHVESQSIGMTGAMSFATMTIAFPAGVHMVLAYALPMDPTPTYVVPPRKIASSMADLAAGAVKELMGRGAGVTAMSVEKIIVDSRFVKHSARLLSNIATRALEIMPSVGGIVVSVVSDLLASKLGRQVEQKDENKNENLSMPQQACSTVIHAGVSHVASGYLVPVVAAAVQGGSSAAIAASLPAILPITALTVGGAIATRSMQVGPKQALDETMETVVPVFEGIRQANQALNGAVNAVMRVGIYATRSTLDTASDMGSEMKRTCVVS